VHENSLSCLLSSKYKEHERNRPRRAANSQRPCTRLETPLARVLLQLLLRILDDTQPRSSPDPPRRIPLTNDGRKRIRDSGRGDWPCCDRIPKGKGNPWHYLPRQSLSLDPIKTTSLTYRARPQAMSENDVIADLLEDNKREIDLLTRMYNEHKELLDQHKLTGDLEQLLACVRCFCSSSEHRLIASMHAGT
jgi:hypothetical protein